MAIEFPPGLILVLGAFLLPLVRGRLRSLVVGALPLLALAAVWAVPDGTVLSLSFLGFELEPVRATALGRLFATVFALAAFAGGLYAMGRATLLELTAAYAYAGSAIGVTFAGDLLTLFVFWEIMAIGSTLVIWASDQPRAYGASLRYLFIHLLGGVVLMVGIAGHAMETGSLGFEALGLETLGSWMILVGFLVNAGAPPFWSWVPDAYPEASPSGMVFLSAFTTKTAVYTLMVAFPGTGLLIPVGIFMIFYGIFYALLENDIRRILAYSIVNQVGFMLVGIGVGSELALNGAAAQAFAHIVYKALLIMAAGSVLYVTGRRALSELGGLVRSMPLTAAGAVVGGLAISSAPFTSGFVSKSLLVAGVAYEGLAEVWLLLMAASAGSFLYVGLRLPWFAFFDRDAGLEASDPPLTMRLGLWLMILLSIGIGVYPQPLYAMLPFPVDYDAYTVDHVLSQLQILLFAGLAFYLTIRLLRPRPRVSVDLDWLYRKAGPAATAAASRVTVRAGHAVESRIRTAVRAVMDKLFQHHGPSGILARTWPTGSMVLWVTVLLGAFLLFYYV